MRPRPFALPFTVLLLAACSRDPSPAAVERVLVAHPEVLAAAIKAHPTEFMQAVNGALQAAQAAQQQAAQDKMEEEFRNPKQPDIAGPGFPGQSRTRR